MSVMMVGIILNSVQWLEDDTADTVLKELEDNDLTAWKVSDTFVQVMIGDVAFIMQRDMAVVFVPNYVNGFGSMLLPIQSIVDLDAG